MNPLWTLSKSGQSVWFDFIRRELLDNGGLRKLVDNDRIGGVTSNPTIFDKAIGAGTDYDTQISTLKAQNSGLSLRELYESLVAEDIRRACDELMVVYERTDGADGFVSVEVSPHLARDTENTVAEARHLWGLINRPNLMIKVPGTDEGVPAIETLISEGVNVNVTLLFSLAQYEAIANAYLRGLKKCADPSKVGSVASFFISRVDTSVDTELDGLDVEAAAKLKGRIAIANAKMVYARFRELFGDEALDGLAMRGAHPQRVLWASTGTKNPEYSDVLYVEELIGDATVNTMPPATMDAFRDHGEVRGATILEDVESAKSDLETLAGLGIDINAITDRLLDDGVKAFEDSFDSLMSTIAAKWEKSG